MSELSNNIYINRAGLEKIAEIVAKKSEIPTHLSQLVNDIGAGSGDGSGGGAAVVVSITDAQINGLFGGNS